MENLQLTDAIKACQAGDTASFGQIYDAYIGKIYSFLYYRVSHKPTAEDLTSLTFFKALDRISTFDPSKGTFQSWLYQIARNSMIDHFRVHKQTLELDEARETGSGENMALNVENKLRLEQVMEQLGKLPVEHKDLILMRVWDGLSYSEISEITGKTENALKMAVSRILSKIRAETLAAFALFLALIMN